MSMCHAPPAACPGRDCRRRQRPCEHCYAFIHTHIRTPTESWRPEPDTHLEPSSRAHACSKGSGAVQKSVTLTCRAAQVRVLHRPTTHHILRDPMHARRKGRISHSNGIHTGPRSIRMQHTRSIRMRPVRAGGRRRKCVTGPTSAGTPKCRNPAATTPQHCQAPGADTGNSGAAWLPRGIASAWRRPARERCGVCMSKSYSDTAGKSSASTFTSVPGPTTP